MLLLYAKQTEKKKVFRNFAYNEPNYPNISMFVDIPGIEIKASELGYEMD